MKTMNQWMRLFMVACIWFAAEVKVTTGKEDSRVITFLPNQNVTIRLFGDTPNQGKVYYPNILTLPKNGQLVEDGITIKSVPHVLQKTSKVTYAPTSLFNTRSTQSIASFVYAMVSTDQESRSSNITVNIRMIEMTGTSLGCGGKFNELVVMGESGFLQIPTNSTVVSLTYSRKYASPVIITGTPVLPQPPLASDRSLSIAFESIDDDQALIKLSSVPEQPITLPYMVLERGAYRLPTSNMTIDVGSMVVSSTATSKQQGWQSIHNNYVKSPAIFTTIQTSNDPSWAIAREKQATDVTLATLQEDRGSEVVGYLIFDTSYLTKETNLWGSNFIAFDNSSQVDTTKAFSVSLGDNFDNPAIFGQLTSYQNTVDWQLFAYNQGKTFNFKAVSQSDIKGSEALSYFVLDDETRILSAIPYECFGTITPDNKNLAVEYGNTLTLQLLPDVYPMATYPAVANLPTLGDLYRATIGDDGAVVLGQKLTQAPVFISNGLLVYQPVNASDGKPLPYTLQTDQCFTVGTQQDSFGYWYQNGQYTSKSAKVIIKITPAQQTKEVTTTSESTESSMSSSEPSTTTEQNSPHKEPDAAGVASLVLLLVTVVGVLVLIVVLVLYVVYKKRKHRYQHVPMLALNEDDYEEDHQDEIDQESDMESTFVPKSLRIL